MQHAPACAACCAAAPAWLPQCCALLPSCPPLVSSEADADAAHRRIQRLRAFHYGAAQFVAALQAFLHARTAGGRWPLLRGGHAPGGWVLEREVKLHAGQKKPSGVRGLGTAAAR